MCVEPGATYFDPDGSSILTATPSITSTSPVIRILRNCPPSPKVRKRCAQPGFTSMHRRDGRVHHFLERNLELRHIVFTAHSNANIRRPHRPHAANINLFRRHRVVEGFAVALGIDHEAV